MRCFCHVVELSDAVIQLMETPAAYGRIVNLGSGNLITIIELAKLVIERTGSSSKIEHIPFEEIYGPDYDDMARRHPDTSVARELIGFDAKRTLADIVDDVIAWQKTEWDKVGRELDY